MLYVSILHTITDIMFGLPLLTVVSAGGAVLIIVIALVHGGLSFKKTQV